MFKGEKVTPTPVLEPAVDGVEYTLEVIMGTGVVSVQKTSIWGEKAGVATVRCTAVGKNASCDFEVKVTECKINVQGKTLIVGETYTPTVTVDPEIPGFTVRYLIISGSKVVSVSGNTIKADSVGNATLRCVIDGTGFFADFNIEVINYVITAKDLEIYEGDVVSIGATVSPYKKLVYEVVAGENAIIVDADGKITAKEKGQAVLRITAEGTDVYTDVTVLVRGYTVTAENIEMMVLDGALINATVTPEKGRTVTYTIREGEGVITLEGNKVVAVAPGVAVVRVSVEGVDAKVDITVTVNNYEIYSPNVSLYIGSTAKLQPTATPEKQFSYRYEVISGKDVVSVSSGVVTALKQGVAEIKITANEVPAEKIIKVTVADYAITVDDMRVYVGETKRIEAVVVPSKDNPVFAFDIIAGDEYIEIVNGSIIGVAPGRAIVRCSMSGSFAHFDFTITVEHEMVAVPEGYVKISDSLYASYAAGRYKSAIVIDFFTPYKKAQLYYTSDGKQYNRDYSFSSRWSGPVWLTERRGTLIPLPRR